MDWEHEWNQVCKRLADVKAERDTLRTQVTDLEWAVAHPEGDWSAGYEYGCEEIGARVAEVEAERDALRARVEEFAELWRQYLSAQRTIDQGGYMDNYTDVARARDRQAKILDETRALLAAAGEE